MSEPDQNWVTVGEIIGALVFGAVVYFRKLYSDARSEERNRVERQPELAMNAVGAAFVDRTAAQAIVNAAEILKNMASDLRAILELMREREERDHDDRLERRLLDVLETREKKKAEG